MVCTEKFTLENLIDQESLGRIQSELSAIVGFSVVTVRIDGTPISGLSNFTKFCQLLRSSKAGRLACIECDRIALQKAQKKGHPIIYDCHCGLKDCAVPIIVDNTAIGGVLGGQVIVRAEDRANVDTEGIAREFNIDKNALDAALDEIEVVTEGYLQKCLKFYGFLAEYVAEKGYQTLIQQKLSEETMARIRLQQIATDQMVKRMQAQMNPHFLFNTLNSIARMAMMEQSSTTEQLIYDLSDYLHYTIKNHSDLSTITMELDNLKHYLNIQELRFGNRFTCQIEVDSTLRECLIPSMTLQPLVENSIIHGLKDRTEGGIIKVSITKCKRGNKKDILIVVYDNGCGFPESVMELFNSEKEIETTTLGLGLTNTQLRLQKLYGEEYGISIDSKPNKYTQLNIYLPARTL